MEILNIALVVFLILFSWFGCGFFGLFLFAFEDWLGKREIVINFNEEAEQVLVFIGPFSIAVFLLYLFHILGDKIKEIRCPKLPVIKIKARK